VPAVTRTPMGVASSGHKELKNLIFGLFRSTRLAEGATQA